MWLCLLLWLCLPEQAMGWLSHRFGVGSRSYINQLNFYVCLHIICTCFIIILIFELEPHELILSYNYRNILNHYTEKLPPDMNRDVIITAVVLSIVVFIFSSTLFFILGCVCGWVGHKYKTKWSDKNTHSHCQAAPLYEDLQPSMPMSMPGE